MRGIQNAIVGEDAALENHSSVYKLLRRLLLSDKSCVALTAEHANPGVLVGNIKWQLGTGRRAKAVFGEESRIGLPRRACKTLAQQRKPLGCGGAEKHYSTVNETKRQKTRKENPL